MPAIPAVPGNDAAARRWAAVLAAGALISPLLAGCSSQDDGGDEGSSGAAHDLRTADRDQLAGGGTLRWAIDKPPETLNTFQPDADRVTDRVAEATLPMLFTVDERAEPELNEDYLESAEVTEREPRQTVVYKLNPKAKWSDGRALGADDFVAQWKALNGKNSAFWTARNAGYDRIGSVTEGDGANEVEVTFAKPYADWKSLFAPLYPKSVMGDSQSFNEGTREALPVTSGPFKLGQIGKDSARLERNAAWWGDPAKLSAIELKAVPRDKREAALASGDLDYAEIDTPAAQRILSANAASDGKNSGEDGAEDGRNEDGKNEDGDGGEGGGADAKAGAADAPRLSAAQRQLRGYDLRKALDSAYTQLAMNGSSGPLSDQRVRRAIARAIDRQDLAERVLGEAGLPAKPLGSHLRMRDQAGYSDNSSAIGQRNVESAQSLLADAGWSSGGGGAPGGTAPTGDAEDAQKKGTKAPDAEQEADGKPPEEGQRGADEQSGGQTDQSGEPSEGASLPGGPDSAAMDEPLSDSAVSRAASGPLSLEPTTARQRAGLLTQAATAQRAASGADGDAEGEAADASEASGAEAASEGNDRDEGNEGDGGETPSEVEKRSSALLAEARDAREAAKELGLLSSGASNAVRTKGGEQLTLDFVLPAGPGTESIRETGKRIAESLDEIGVRTNVRQVADDSFFKDHVAAGEYDLALYSWPASPYPATDAQPIFAKPEPAADGSLLVDQNYTRVGTDQIDQLFEEAVGELDDEARQKAMKRADERIWAAAGSLPLFQRPQLVALGDKVANAGAFGFQTPRYQDIGFQKS